MNLKAKLIPKRKGVNEGPNLSSNGATSRVEYIHPIIADSQSTQPPRPEEDHFFLYEIVTNF